MRDTSDYWSARKNHIYLLAVRTIVEQLGQKAQSLVDVGSNGCPYLDWFEWIHNRTSIDIDNPYTRPSVHAVKADFMKWEPDKKYDMSLCLQVLEHVEEPHSFAQKLLNLSDVAVISVPYNWPAGRTKGHIHDPVDEKKMYDWFGREPNFSYIATEVVSPVSRLVCVYERDINFSYRSLGERSQKLSRSRNAEDVGPRKRRRAETNKLGVFHRKARKVVSINGIRRIFE